MMNVKFVRLAALLVASLFSLVPQTLQAAEGGMSLYLPGAAGDLLLALSPGPGLQASQGFFVQTGSVDRTVRQGEVNLGLDVEIFLNFTGLAYTVDKKILGGSYTFGGSAVYGSLNLEAAIEIPGGGTIGASGDAFSLADTAFVPFQLNWSVGTNLHFKLAEAIVAPTGAYDVNVFTNLGRNYWAFDTVAAVTYFHQETGTEVSVAPGLMMNTTNNATDYRTGNEFHMDFTVNQFLSETFALGLRGYLYDQVTGDSGSGARLGDFKSESFGLGFGVFWTPKFANGKFVLVAKYMNDVHAENRLESEFGTIGVAWKF